VSATFNVCDLAPHIEDGFEDLRANPSQEDGTDLYQAPSQFLTTYSSLPTYKLNFLDQDDHRSNISLWFDLACHHPNKVQLGQSVLVGKLRESTLR